MSKKLKPGSNTGKNGGIYQEVGPRGGAKENFATVADNTRLPPTQNPNSSWKPISRTPNSTR